MRLERLLPIILVILGAAALISAYRHKTRVIPVPPEWADNQGVRLFFEQECVNCHTVTRLPGARGTLGPGLDNIGDRAAKMNPNGDSRVYLKESILEPGKVVREGFVNAMPSFTNKLSDEELNALVDWLSELKIDASSKERAAR